MDWACALLSGLVEESGIRVPSTDSLSRRPRAVIVALLFGAVYFLTEGLAELFHRGKPYLKLLKQVGLRLPIEGFF